jgi:endonuclease YncB( thermonuclease family)
MKYLLAFFLAFTTAITVAQPKREVRSVTYDAVITRVIDGDTIAFRADFLPDPLKKELSLRVYGVDTPEKGHRAKCAQEDTRGKAASEFTSQMIARSKRHQIQLISWDKYGGRVLGDLILDGQSLRSLLIQRGFAREYWGDAKTSWC